MAERPGPVRSRGVTTNTELDGDVTMLQPNHKVGLEAVTQTANQLPPRPSSWLGFDGKTDKVEKKGNEKNP